MEVLFLMSFFRVYSRSKLSFEHSGVRKNLFFSSFCCWDARFSSFELDQKSNFAGTIGYWCSYLVFLFRHFKLFRLHAKIHVAAGARGADSSRFRGYLDMIGRGQSSCLLVHVTGLVFCLYVKLLLPSIFDSVDFCNSMSCNVLHFEISDLKLNKDLGVVIYG